MIRAVLILAAAATLCACSPGPRPDPKLDVQKVDIAVAKGCVPPEVQPAPTKYPDDGLTDATTPDERYLAVAAANQLRKSRLAVVEPVIAACRH